MELVVVCDLTKRNNHGFTKSIFSLQKMIRYIFESCVGKLHEGLGNNKQDFMQRSFQVF